MYDRFLHGFDIDVSANSVTPATVSSHYHEEKMVKNGATQNNCAFKECSILHNNIVFLFRKAFFVQL